MSRPGARARTLIVCPLEAPSAGCRFHGDGGIQDAIDSASDGDTILIKRGHYSPIRTRDVPYKDFIVRAYIAVDHKRLSISGEDGTVLDGRIRLAATAMVINRADVTIRNLDITGFRYAVEEDDIYDGHGIFVIDSRARIEHVTLTRLAKMALTGRGDSQLEVSGLQVRDGRLGVWLNETTYLRLRNSVFRNNDSCGVGAYNHSTAHISNSLFDGNRDDGVYAEQQADVFVTNSLILKQQAGRRSCDPGEPHLFGAQCALWQCRCSRIAGQSASAPRRRCDRVGYCGPEISYFRMPRAAWKPPHASRETDYTTG